MQRILKSIKNIQDADVRLQLRDEYEKLRRERQKIESRDSMDETYRRLRYVRYADDFLIGVIGSKAECVKSSRTLPSIWKKTSSWNCHRKRH